MAAGTNEGTEIIGVTDGSLDLRITVDRDRMARLVLLAAPADPDGRPPEAVPAPAGLPASDAALPLLDVIVSGEGRGWSGNRYCESVAGGRFRYAGHDETVVDEIWRQLRVDLDDPRTGLHAEIFYRALAGHGGLRAWVRLENRGAAPVPVESVTSFLCGGISSPAHGPGGDGPDDLSDLDLLWAENDWLAESRWQLRAVRDALPDVNRGVHGADPRGCFGVTSTGSWSSGGHLPAGAIVNRRTGHTWVWQIEHNGAWHWQVGECTHRSAVPRPSADTSHAPAGSRTGAYLALLGPADNEHQWRTVLSPGESFTTVPVAVAVSCSGFDGAVAGLTAIRRATRRAHEDRRRLPVIFNDYMNTLKGDPTTDRLLPLIDAAAGVGAEFFCIDAGWYAALDEGWWNTVGEWRPSHSRFPNGITQVLDRIRTAGMTPGLWLEPEVVGVHSPLVRHLPPQAFFRHDGQPIVEHGRYHLDLRHPAAVKHLDEVVDFAVADLGVGYLKLDYNIQVCPGPDTGGLSPGAGLLAANRAHLSWLDGVLDRHPHLVIENCASGGMRADYALLSRLHLQSTSDQQDYLRYPPIAAAAPAAMTPEQTANWAYPQPDFTDEEITFTLCGAMLGRLYLSGHLDQMDPGQLALVAEAVGAYKSIREQIATAVPFWPLGLPRWTDSWIAVGLRSPEATYLTVWHRGPLAGQDSDPPEKTIPMPGRRDIPLTLRALFPGGADTDADWDPERGTLTVNLPRTPSARVFALTRGRPEGPA